MLYWNYESNEVYWNYECSFRKKLIIASKQNSTVFNFALNTCQPNDLFCKFHDSIVIWNESIIFNNSFFRIHYGTNYTRKNNLVYSLADRFLFQITTSKIEKSYTVFSTTDGLFLVFENSDNFFNKYSILSLSFAKTQKSLLIQKDIDSLILAEHDLDRFYLENAIGIEQNNNIVQHCIEFKNNLNTLAMFEDVFHSLSDLNGNKLYLFSTNNVLLIPNCRKISKINIRNMNDCYKDIPVSMTVKNTTVNVFLT
ncbi:unnamed protein product [Brachionus calyciflorus]|uniref:Uncharacterized protein n=1 Tax=Brachionus calyciflorus TaxID=104777 RepID=A0A814F7B5_9BILA|nr:unnamed protein product [Brachionus calyciflorus]